MRVPVIDIVEIGAGGGLHRLVRRGRHALRGPPAAPVPIPALPCYGRGGSEPTVTDAKLITGVLNPANFAGGRLSLDIDRARTAMGKVADGLAAVSTRRRSP